MRGELEGKGGGWDGREEGNGGGRRNGGGICRKNEGRSGEGKWKR